jgi:heme exporter protein A
MALEAASEWAVQTEGLRKTFGHVSVLRDINLKIPNHHSATIVGPNGAGKTTLLRILATLTRPSAGRVWVDGLDLHDWGTQACRRIGFASHQFMLYLDLSPQENLRFYGRMYGVPDLEPRIAELLAQVGLGGRRNDPVRTLSRGMQQRLSLARAILHDPSVVLLDEPYTGLDPRAADALSTLLRGLLAQGRTVLMTTHDLARGAEMADQVLVLVAGQVTFQVRTADLSPQELRELYDQHVAPTAPSREGLPLQRRTEDRP